MSNSKNLVILTKKDWLYNAGLIGLYNILTLNKENLNKVELTKNELKFDINILEKLNEYLIEYFFDLYKEENIFEKLVSYKYYLEKLKEDENFENEIDKNKLKNIKINIDEFLKDTATKKVLSLEKYINNEEIENYKKVKIEDNNFIEKTLQVLEIFKDKNIQDTINLKRIINKKMNYFINNIYCFNPTNKDKRPEKEQLKEHFQSLLKYNDKKTDKKGYLCSCCNEVFSKKEELSNYCFIPNLGFDIVRKKSNSYNFQDITLICDMCKLVYFCYFSSFIFVKQQAILINYSKNLKQMQKINQSIKNELKIAFKNEDKINLNRILFEMINKNIHLNVKNEIQDIETIRFSTVNNNLVRNISILTKKQIMLIKNSDYELKSLFNTFLESKYTNTKNLFSRVFENIIDNKNNFNLIYEIFSIKIKNTNVKHNIKFKNIFNIIKINSNFLESENQVMKNENLEKIRSQGFYDSKKINNLSENKLKGIILQLLECLRINNVQKFLDILIKISTTYDFKVNKLFIDNLEDLETFKNLGYAYLTGLQGNLENILEIQVKGE